MAFWKPWTDPTISHPLLLLLLLIVFGWAQGGRVFALDKVKKLDGLKEAEFFDHITSFCMSPTNTASRVLGMCNLKGAKK
ncbi:hypothetical protein AXX17_AT5G65150 [Arabidopsis thaliana]|uniref:Transmembrane protein n=1 Tax=Arabidopsis thaliana TaxID=3702 RepID=A0A178UAE7_ARATH|nr:hypothetical protein AXX17_AT5G65150 [Arabidopsis thaliana]